jgi:hypothetical protein
MVGLISPMIMGLAAVSLSAALEIDLGYFYLSPPDDS